LKEEDDVNEQQRGWGFFKKWLDDKKHLQQTTSPLQTLIPK
jgi:hypothetical protein